MPQGKLNQEIRKSQKKRKNDKKKMPNGMPRQEIRKSQKKEKNVKRKMPRVKLNDFVHFLLREMFGS